MPSPADLERLSMFDAGELNDADAAAMRARLEAEPALREALDTLRQISTDALALDDGLTDAHADALVKGALAANRPAALRRWPAFAAGAIAAALISYVALKPAAGLSVVATSGDVWFAGKPMKSGLAEPFRIGPSLTTGEGSAALAFDGSTSVLVAQHTSIELGDDGVARLVAGAVVVNSDSAEVKLRAGADQVSVSGSAVLLMEPGDEVFRVTAALTPPHTETTMKRWLTLGPTAALGAAAGAGLTLFVLHGEATVSSADAAVVKVAKGQSWSHGDGAARQVSALTVGGEAMATRDGSASNEPGAVGVEPAELKPLTRAQLVARIEALRDEKETLLREKAALKKKADDDEHPKRNYFHLSQEELAASAAKGELRVRMPNFEGKEITVKPEVASDVGIRPEEAEAIKGIYGRSAQRVSAGLQAYYREIGGDPNLASTLSNFTILQELRAKALDGDYANAVRQMANERAGLVPLSDPASGSAVFRAYRMMWAEDDRVVSEVEALLGPSRAEQFLNHPSSDHGDHTWGVGPPKK